MDSLLTHQPEYESFNESAVLGKLYGLFDASGCKVERIQVKDKSVVDNLTQVSIFIQGEGDYNACGSALSGIENMSLPVSVHQCTLKHIGNGRGAITLDFIVMEKTP